jgi:hypothetical protein
MDIYRIQFWRGQEHIFDLADHRSGSIEETGERITALLRTMMDEHHEEDWTGCWVEVTTSGGERVLTVPVLPTMSAIARQTRH